MVATVPVVTNWSVTPQNGQVGYFTLMNTWLFESTSVIASLNTAIIKINEAGQDINDIGTNAINAISPDDVEDLATYTGTGLVIVKDINRGGTFVSKTAIEINPHTGSLYAVDGGTVFAKLGGGFWARQYIGAVNVKWFGAKGDGATNDYQSFLKASLLNKPIELKDGAIYNLETQLVLDNSAFDRAGIFCNGQATITSTSLASSFIKIIDGSGDLNKKLKLEGIKFQGFGTRQGIGLEIAGAGGIQPARLTFSNLSRGVLFHNELANSFTEGNVIHNSRFLNCTIPVEYKVTSGNDSFHGSGIKDCWIDTVINNPAIFIGANAFLYNAPIDANIIGHITSTAPLIQNNGVSNRFQTITGNLRLEAHNWRIVDGSPLCLVGGITALDNPILGSLLLADFVKNTGSGYSNANMLFAKPSVTAIKTTTNNQVVNLGNNSTFTISTSTGDSFRFTTRANSGGIPFVSTIEILSGNILTLTNSGDLLQVIVPIAGTVIQIHTISNSDISSTVSGLTAQNYQEI